MIAALEAQYWRRILGSIDAVAYQCGPGEGVIHALGSVRVLLESFGTASKSTSTLDNYTGSIYRDIDTFIIFP